jgi:hypothetical protein
MAQPPAYARAFSFTDWTANNPATPQPGVRLDVEYDAIATTIAALRANLALIQRDDGPLANRSVGPDQLSTELTLGLRSVSEWAALTDYIENDAVWTGGIIYRCDEGHTASASFATDLAAERWSIIFDVSEVVPDAVNAAIANGDIVVGVDTSNFAALNGANAFTGNNTYAGSSTFAQGPIAVVAGGTSAATYFTAKPSDYGVGVPGVFLKKRAAVNEWEFRAEDSAATPAILDFICSFRINGAAPPTTTAMNTAIATAVRKAKHLILAY